MGDRGKRIHPERFREYSVELRRPAFLHRYRMGGYCRNRGRLPSKRSEFRCLRLPSKNGLIASRRRPNCCAATEPKRSRSWISSCQRCWMAHSRSLNLGCFGQRIALEMVRLTSFLRMRICAARAYLLQIFGPVFDVVSSARRMREEHAQRLFDNTTRTRAHGCATRIGTQIAPGRGSIDDPCCRFPEILGYSQLCSAIVVKDSTASL